ncbi:competence protein CoiA family protein [Evansella sp. AB-P1]|uniref:competence protein CoiA n=1 Tax=Evansella sp. AB-P1 TaxID=3037653 RepID=UPI00241F1926|nr:competence protein CoiA family protein [Evansella sp. AB-P1]MDG5789132.1 competence protein CoiA family protein [Evansella sp. AB-P1]
MFIANRKDGSIISLVEKNWRREELQADRENQSYYCPQCNEPLILKLGNQQTWHFAHYPKSSCVLSQTGETESHIKGKKLIIKWLIDHGYAPKIEYYIKEIKQRPDILVTIRGKTYVFEIQQSFISQEEYEKRNETYIKYGFEPIWIGIIRNLEKNYRPSYTTSMLDHFLIRSSPISHSIYLDVETPAWYILQHFRYITYRNAMVFRTNSSLSITPNQLFQLNGFHSSLTLENYTSLYFSKWEKEVRKKRLKMYLSMNTLERYMSKLFQQFQLNLNYFPALAVLPLEKNFNFLSPPEWWQSWLIINFINKTPIGETLQISKVIKSLYFQVELRNFQMRPLLVHPKTLVREAILDYFNALICFHVVVKTHPGVYLIKNHINICKQLDTLCTDDSYVQKIYREGWMKKLNNCHKMNNENFYCIED